MDEPQFGPTRPLVPPLYQSAVYVLPDASAGDRVFAGEDPGFVYARDGHPNARILAGKLAALESAAWAEVTASGMAAVSAVALALTSAGDRVLVADRLYGKSTKLLRQELARFGVRSAAVDVADMGAVEAALAEPARLMMAETLSNPLLRVADVPALAAICRQNRCKLVVDNTFATPALFRPLEHGADVVIESLTKMIGGHSDVTLGLAAGSDPDLGAAVAGCVSTWGFAANPFDCWLADRGLATLALRARAATEAAAELARWLAGRPEVVAVHYPGLAGHPDHALAARLLPAGAGNVLSLEVAGGRVGADAFMRAAKGLPYSPSLGHVASTLSHPATSSHRADSPAARGRQGITEGTLRLSIGCEGFEAAREKIREGLAGLPR